MFEFGMMLGDVGNVWYSHLEVDGRLFTMLVYLMSPCAFCCDKTINPKKPLLGEDSE